MKPLKKKTMPLESEIQRQIVDALTLQGWYCRSTHGNAYQAGFPDLFVASRRFGTRWIEVKRPTKYRFTQSQLDVFTKFSSKNVGVWVLTNPEETNKLMQPSNWYTFLYNSSGIELNEGFPRIPKSGPEAEIQNAIINKMTSSCSCKEPATCSTHLYNNWFCLETYGSAYQAGFPDVYCAHKLFGARWIECKNPKAYRFTPAQMDVFPSFTAQGVPIHILVSAEDSEINKLFGPANWFTYLKL